MLFSKLNRHHTLNGIIFSCLFSFASFYLADLEWVKHVGLSPLVIAIILGMIYGSTLRKHLPHEWTPGIQFVAKRLLRVAIVFYGFRLTFQEVFMVGWGGFIIDVFIVISTMLLGTFAGMKLFKLDRDTSILVSSGAAICGAAAVLATEGVLKSEPHKAAFAVISVVLFGTLAMFLYPFIQNLGWFGFTHTQYGIYVGSTIHEVAQVLVAGEQVSLEAGKIAIIVKMTRVILLAPMLIILGIILSSGAKKRIHHQILASTPWFAVFFVMMIGVNSLHVIPSQMIHCINHLDTFILTAAMAAIGIETDFSKLKTIGVKPLYLSLLLFIWLIVAGYMLNKWI